MSALDDISGSHYFSGFDCWAKRMMMSRYRHKISEDLKFEKRIWKTKENDFLQKERRYWKEKQNKMSSDILVDVKSWNALIYRMRLMNFDNSI